MKITKTSVHVESSTQNICIKIVIQDQNTDNKYKSESRVGGRGIRVASNIRFHTLPPSGSLKHEPAPPPQHPFERFPLLACDSERRLKMFRPNFGFSTTRLTVREIGDIVQNYSRYRLHFEASHKTSNCIPALQFPSVIPPPKFARSNMFLYLPFNMIIELRNADTLRM